MTTIKLKNGSGAPTAGDLVQGEPALDLTNKRLYTEDSGGTVIEVGTNPTSITTGDITATGTVSFAGLGTTGDVTFGDNNKAVFGGSQDLQIYHDASHSYIVDAGTGNMYLSTNGNGIVMQASLSETMFSALPNGSVRLYHDNIQKLETTSTGIDVTGSVVSDGLTVDGSATIQATSSPALIVKDTTNNAEARLQAFNSTATVGTQSNHSFSIETNDTTRALFASGGDISFYNSAGTSQDLFWDASTSRLGLGTTSPDAALEVYGDVGSNLQTNRTAIFRHPNTNQGALEIRNGRGDTVVANRHSSIQSWSNELINPVDLLLNPEGGNVGIGTGSPQNLLHINKSDSLASAAQFTNSTTGATSTDGLFLGLGSGEQGYFWNYEVNDLILGTSNTERMRIDSSGNVGIGTDSPSAGAVGGKVLHVQNSGATASVRVDRSDAATAGTLSITSGNTSNGIYSTGAKDLSIFTNSTEAMRIDSSGNVGIGASNPTRELEVTGSGNVYIKVTAPTSTDSAGLELANTGATWLIQNDDTSNEALTFDRAGTEVMRIDSSGNLLVGTTGTPNGTSVYGSGLFNTGSSGLVQWLSGTSTATTVSVARFYNPNGNVGSIQLSGSATSYVTSSDQRLKENIVDAPSASDDIDAIQVRSFDWKADGSHQKYGMVAQELNTVAPEAVTGDADSDEMMGVDYSKLVPMMLKEIQSLRARVAQLEGAE